MLAPLLLCLVAVGASPSSSGDLLGRVAPEMIATPATPEVHGTKAPSGEVPVVVPDAVPEARPLLPGGRNLVAADAVTESGPKRPRVPDRLTVPTMPIFSVCVLVETHREPVPRGKNVRWCMPTPVADVPEEIEEDENGEEEDCCHQPKAPPGKEPDQIHGEDLLGDRRRRN